MAAYSAVGTGRPVCPHSERRQRLSPRLCLVRCEAQCSGAAQQSTAAKVILPGILAVALMHSSAAHAGVVYQKSENKKFYQGKNVKPKAEQPAQESSGGGFSLPSFPSFSLPSFSLPSLPGLPKPPSLPGLPTPAPPAAPSLSEDFDPKGLALPGAIGGIGVAAFLASKVDKGFGAFMNESLVKDSTNYTGYEEDPPQARGSPEGFLGLGNLYPPALPFGKETADKVRAATTPPKGSGKSSKKGTIAIGKSKGKQSKSGGKGLFGFGK